MIFSLVGLPHHVSHLFFRLPSLLQGYSPTQLHFGLLDRDILLHVSYNIIKIQSKAVMSDPLSIAASAAGLVSLGLTVCSGLVDYYNAWKDQPSDVAAMCDSMRGLGKTFELLDEKVRHPLLDRECVDRVTESIISCAAGVHGL